VSLKVNIPGVKGRRDVIDRPGIGRITHVDDAEAFREHVPHVRVAAVDHKLDSVAAAALVAVPDEPHVAGMVGANIHRHGHGIRFALSGSCISQPIRRVKELMWWWLGGYSVH
jgi:hypothetical protein